MIYHLLYKKELRFVYLKEANFKIKFLLSLLLSQGIGIKIRWVSGEREREREREREQN